MIKNQKGLVMANRPPDRSPLGLARIARETVQERVYGVLRDQLMRGGFEPGQKLKIAALASELGTSAMPVREALNRLAAERAIESLPNRSVRVPSLSKDALQDLMETRFAVEGLAVARAAANMTPETLAHLRELIAEQSETDSEHISEASAERNRTFHFTIYRQSGSTVLLPIIESLWLQFGPYLRVASERFDGREGRGTNFHVEIVAALERRDDKAARSALESDIGRSFKLVMEDPQLWQHRGGVA
jgi:DNA-binding GntR family transcriptional regulator